MIQHNALLDHAPDLQRASVSHFKPHGGAIICNLSAHCTLWLPGSRNLCIPQAASMLHNTSKITGDIDRRTPAAWSGTLAWSFGWLQ